MKPPFDSLRDAPARLVSRILAPVQKLRSSIAATFAQRIQSDQPYWRIRLLLGAFLFFWVLLAMVEYTPRISSLGEGLNNLFIALFPGDSMAGMREIFYDAFSFLINQVFLRFFSLRVLRHLPIVFILFWFISDKAVAYLQDLFELEDRNAAWLYLQRAVLGRGNDTLEITNGDFLPGHEKKPMALIGGPGTLQIHLGNAAVFEKVNGTFAVYDALRSYPLSNFERLRKAVDLRDIRRVIPTVNFVTTDGVLMSAANVVVDFRIATQDPYRRREKQRNSLDPYPFDAQSLATVVYDTPVNEKGEANWHDVVQQKVTEIVAHYLSGFPSFQLVNMDMSDEIRRRLVNSFTEGEALSLGGTSPSQSAREILYELGAEAEWVGVGHITALDDLIQTMLERTKNEWSKAYRSHENSRKSLENEAKQRESMAYLELIQVSPPIFPEQPGTYQRIIDFYDSLLKSIGRSQFNAEPEAWPIEYRNAMEKLSSYKYNTPHVLGMDDSNG